MSSLFELLSYGAPGLALALAILAYWLLRREQTIPKPRRDILKTIYVFMAFALILALVGFITAFKTNQEVSQTVFKTNQQISELKNARSKVEALMVLKEGKVDRLLEQLGPNANEQFFREIREIQTDLREIDHEINKALGPQKPE
jgi:predicted PurR-regulated permease PerM